MPQPWRGDFDTPCSWGPYSIEDHPLAARIGDVINAWSHTEFQMGVFLAKIMRTSAEMTAAIYSEFVLSGGHQKVLHVAARERLNEDEYNLFQAIFKLHSSAAKRRHSIAHGIWGAETEDALLWWPMTSLLKQEAAQMDHVHRSINEGRPPLAVMREVKENRRAVADETLVYVEKDFADLVADIAEVHGYWSAFTHLVWLSQIPGADDPEKVAAREAQRLRLCSEPPIRAVLEKIRNQAGKAPA